MMQLGIFAVLLGMSLPMIPASPLATTFVSLPSYVTGDEPLQTVAPSAGGVSVEGLQQGQYVVTVVNSHTAAIVTAHNQNLGSPPALHDNGGTIPSGSTAIFAAPSGVSEAME